MPSIWSSFFGIPRDVFLLSRWQGDPVRGVGIPNILDILWWKMTLYFFTSSHWIYNLIISWSQGQDLSVLSAFKRRWIKRCTKRSSLSTFKQHFPHKGQDLRTRSWWESHLEHCVKMSLDEWVTSALLLSLFIMMFGSSSSTFVIPALRIDSRHLIVTLMILGPEESTLTQIDLIVMAVIFFFSR